MSDAPNHLDPRMLSYRAGEIREDESPLISRIVLILFSWVGVWSVYCHVATRVAQWWKGSKTLFAPATGTHLYDYLLIYVPFWAVTAGLFVLLAISFALAWSGRWVPYWLPLVGLAMLAWFGFLALVFSLWDDISP